MNSDQIQSLVRALLTSAGAGLVTSGIINGGQLNDAIGSAITLGAIAWSIWQKRESAKLTKAIATVNSAVSAGDASHVITSTGTTIVQAP